MHLLSKYQRAGRALGYAFSDFSLCKKALKLLYVEGSLQRKSLPKKNLHDLVRLEAEINLHRFLFVKHNVEPFELMALCLLVKEKMRILEIGTFDGNTTLQLALNAPEEAVVHTIDLPPGVSTSMPIPKEDEHTIAHPARAQKRYVGSASEKKIKQHFGDTASYDFKQFGSIDFCFIDGAHSYEYVKNDTEKALSILAPNGMIVWHDFDPDSPGVYRYLLELSKKHPLVHIAGTRLVLYDAKNSS